MVYLQQKFKKLPDPAKMMKMYNMFKAEIASFEQELENEFDLDTNKINSKYGLVNDRITSTVNQLRKFFTSPGIELTNSEISPPKINLTELVSVMLNNLALEIPQKSKEKSRRSGNAKCQRRFLLV